MKKDTPFTQRSFQEVVGFGLGLIKIHPLYLYIFVCVLFWRVERENMSNVAQIPTSFGHELRACLRCRLVKTYDQFRESGCENCPFFDMDKEHEVVGDCTTSNFTGIISVMDPTRSWAAKWLRIGRFLPGCYTLAVTEVLPEEYQTLCAENHVPYIPPKRV